MYLVDAHCDAPTQMYRGRDFGKDNPGVQVDFPKMIRGGVTGSFFALYIPARLTNEEASKYALAQLDVVKRQVALNSDKVAFATDKATMEVNASKGLSSIFLGLENGSALLGREGMLEHLYGEGVRYVTLCHSEDNDICDSCTGKGRWGGLSPLGKELVKRMNALGMTVDLAHTSNDTVRDVLALSEKPVAYTHGCCSALCSHPRNLPDDLIAGIARKGGVVCISIYPCFLTDEFASFDDDAPDGREMPEPSLVLDHLRHAVEVAGVDGVGIGTDFDGINHTAKGLESVDKIQNLLNNMKESGFGNDAIAKIASGNLLRVISAQE